MLGSFTVAWCADLHSIYSKPTPRHVNFNLLCWKKYVKNLDIILFTYTGKSLFHCSRSKDIQLMRICLLHVKVIVRDQMFFMNFTFFVVKKGHIYQVFDSPIHCKHDGENFNSIHQSFHKLQLFLVSTYNSFSLYWLYKSIFSVVANLLGCNSESFWNIRLKLCHTVHLAK